MTYFGDIDLSKIEIGPLECTHNGGKFQKISYPNINGQSGQFKDIQLGKDVHDIVRCPFGIESVSQEQTNKLCIKINVDTKLYNFIKSLDKKVIDAVDNSSFTHRSTLKESQINTMKIKIMPDTQIFLTSFKENNVLSRPVVGNLDDIKPGCKLLPIVKIKGGIYFVDSYYGTSIVASQILIIGGSNPEVQFSFGDVVFDS